MYNGTIKKIQWLVSLLLVPVLLICQDKISGKVVSDKQVPLAGASVFIPNTTTGDITHNNGEFVLHNMPAGNSRIVVSFVGYQTVTLTVNPKNSEGYIITLNPLIRDLQDITLRPYDKDGWELWGQVFTSAFIGNAAYATKCVIKNKDAIKFLYNENTHQLNAWAEAPLIIENNALGYIIRLTLADFVYNTETKNVDYRSYSFFTEMEGNEKEKDKWKKNRMKAYDYSMMHFMRTLYSGELAKEGYEIRRMEKRKNVERQRIQSLYQQSFLRIKDSIGTTALKENMINKLIERSFKKDSLKYYRSVLEQNENTVKLHKQLLTVKNFLTKTDSNTVILNFNDYLHVTYKKTKEPDEYVQFINNNEEGISQSGVLNATMLNTTLKNPSTEFNLQQGIPIEISENGYFANIDLYMVGFWGWWEKLATKLPYGYKVISP